MTSSINCKSSLLNLVFFSDNSIFCSEEDDYQIGLLQRRRLRHQEDIACSTGDVEENFIFSIVQLSLLVDCYVEKHKEASVTAAIRNSNCAGYYIC